MPIHPLTSRVVIVFEQDLERASRHLSVTPTIPNKLHKILYEISYRNHHKKNNCVQPNGFIGFIML